MLSLPELRPSSTGTDSLSTYHDGPPTACAERQKMKHNRKTPSTINGPFIDMIKPTPARQPTAISKNCTSYLQKERI